MNHNLIARRLRRPAAFTDQARRVVVLAQEEARMLNHNYIGTVHILLGLIREGDVAVQVLVKLGADLDRLRQQAIQLTRGHQAVTSMLGNFENLEPAQRGVRGPQP